MDFDLLAFALTLKLLVGLLLLLYGMKKQNLTLVIVGTLIVIIIIGGLFTVNGFTLLGASITLISTISLLLYVMANTKII